MAGITAITAFIDPLPVRRSLEESEEKVTKFKKDRYNMDLKIQLGHTKAAISKREEQHQNDEYISLQRALLDKAVQKEHFDLSKRTEKAHIAVLDKVLSDQCVLYAQKIEWEGDLANEVLQKAREENYDNINNERQKYDCMINQTRTQLVELENERSKLKSLIESLIQQHEACGKMNVEVTTVLY
jgi:hypothetical protein